METDDFGEGVAAIRLSAELRASRAADPYATRSDASSDRVASPSTVPGSPSG